MAFHRQNTVRSAVETGGESAACGCCAAPLGRRRFLGFALSAGLAAAAPISLSPGTSRAADGKAYEAMLLTCIDPRFLETARGYMVHRHWLGQYSQFSFAGAAIGAVAPKFESWHETFWDNLKITIQLHRVKNMVALDHRDCGAAKLAYGDDSVATHRKALEEFRHEVGQRHKELHVITGLIGLDHKIRFFG